MTKIDFDLNFLNNNKPIYEIKTVQSASSSHKWSWIVLGILGIIIITSVYAWQEHQKATQIKIQQLAAQAYQYKKTQNPLYEDVIHKLAQLTDKEKYIIDKDIELTLMKEKLKKFKQIVRSKIENKVVDETLKAAYLKDYFNNDVKLFEEAIEREFIIQKKQVILKLIKEWKNNSPLFEINKKKYVKTLFNNSVEQFNRALDEALGYKNFTLVEQKLPPTGIMRIYSKKEAIAPFKITTQKSSSNDTYSMQKDHYYVKLVDEYTQRTVVTIFIRSGSDVEVQVPVGSYKLRYAVGNKWYGEKDLFGHFGSYNKSDEILNFSKDDYFVNGHSLVLYKVPHGNFSTQPINQENF